MLQELKALPVQSINRIRLEFKAIDIVVNRFIANSINRIRLEFKGV